MFTPSPTSMVTPPFDCRCGYRTWGGPVALAGGMLVDLKQSKALKSPCRTGLAALPFCQCHEKNMSGSLLVQGRGETHGTEQLPQSSVSPRPAVRHTVTPAAGAWNTAAQTGQPRSAEPQTTHRHADTSVVMNDRCLKPLSFWFIAQQWKTDTSSFPQ